MNGVESAEMARGRGVFSSGFYGWLSVPREIGHITPFCIAHDAWEIPTAIPLRGNPLRW